MGISYVDDTGIAGIALTADTFENSGGNGPHDWDDFTYSIDTEVLEANGFLHTDTITIKGDWHRGDDFNADGYGTPVGGEYYGQVLTGPAMPGSFTLDSYDGTFEWNVTIADLVAYAQTYAADPDSPTAINMRFSGDYGPGNSDSDKFKIIIKCFLPGTRIATSQGEIAVESLSIGDLILTADGRSVPVKWVGRKTMTTSVFLDDTMLPVCISAGALGNGLPRQDLYLSANHAMVMDGVLVNAGAMVNGGTIRFVPMAEMPKTFTYYHIETEAHDEILANGSASETFVDYVGRKGFDNYGEYLALYGADRIIPEMKRLRVSSRRQLPQALREQLGVASFEDAVSAELDRLLAVA